MKALVTGGAGFIGSHLVDRLLAEGHQVQVIDNLSSGSLSNLDEARANSDGRFHFDNIDIRTPEIVDVIAKRRPEVIFHLAAQADVRVSVSDPVLDAEVNVVGGLRVLEGAKAAGSSKIVFAASGGTLYGDVPAKRLPIRESEPHKPLSPYGVSKKAMCDYLSAYRELYALEFTALALANVYGTRQDPSGEAGVVAVFAGHLLAGEPCTIFGTGEQTRDFVYVDDVVDAFSKAAGKGDGLIINIGTGVETSVNELYAAMAVAARSDLDPARASARSGELERSCLDPGRARTHLGWSSWTSIQEGVTSVIDDLRHRR